MVLEALALSVPVETCFFIHRTVLLNLKKEMFSGTSPSTSTKPDAKSQVWPLIGWLLARQNEDRLLEETFELARVQDFVPNLAEAWG